MTAKERARWEPVLDPLSRTSEVIFGLLMALSFTGTLSAATAGREEVRTMMLAALGCNLAWGLVDAVMYLIVTRTNRARSLTLLRKIRNAPDRETAHETLSVALPEHLGGMIGSEGLEALRQRLVTQPDPGSGRLHPRDFLGALGVFLLVVLVTFPVVIPFMFINETLLAMRVSNGIALVLLFVAGVRLGGYAGVSPWRYGLAMTAIGAFLVSSIIALGG